jgi:Domain of unknown function (DUF6249)
VISSFAFVGVAFWVFMAAVVISEDIGKTKRRAADLDLIRFAIEKGQPLDPAIVQQILAKPTATLFVGGVITIAAGIGLLVFAIFLSRITLHGGWVIAGAGGIAICVGIGLIVSHRLTSSSGPMQVALA